MGFYRFVLGYMKNFSVPVFKSFFKAYKDTTAGARANQSGKKHPIDDYFKSLLAKTNMAAPPLDAVSALRILNIEKQAGSQIDPKHILERYYILYKKNDPKMGGTSYLQSKVFAAKECLMNQFQDAPKLEQQFYKEVVEPEQKAEEEEAKKTEQQELNQQNKQKK